MMFHFHRLTAVARLHTPNTRRPISGSSFTDPPKRSGKAIGDWIKGREGFFQGATKKQINMVEPLSKEAMEKLNLQEDLKGKRVSRAKNHAKLAVGSAVASVVVALALSSEEAAEGSEGKEPFVLKMMRRMGMKRKDIAELLKKYLGLNLAGKGEDST